MRRQRWLITLVLILLFILAAQAGLLDWLRLIDFGAFFFPKRGHADGIDLLLSGVINIVIYGAFVYLIASALLWLFLKYKEG